MEVIIFGANTIGEYIAQTLQDRYEVMVIDENVKACDIIAEKHDVDVLSKLDMDTLDKLPWEKIEYVYAVMDEIERNVLLSIYAKSRGVPKVVCRLKDESYRDLLERMHIEVVSNINLAQHALLITHRSLIYKLLNFKDSSVILEEIEGKKFKGKTVKQLEEKLNVRVVAIFRAHEFFLPDEEAEILEEDLLVVAKQII